MTLMAHKLRKAGLLTRQQINCARKLAFARRPKERLTDAGFWLRGYQCEVCHKWHLTSKPQSEEQSR